jgi:hypothetical protein
MLCAVGGIVVLLVSVGLAAIAMALCWRLIALPRGTFTDERPAGIIAAIDRYFLRRDTLHVLARMQGRPSYIGVRPKGRLFPSVRIHPTGLTVHAQMDDGELENRLRAAGIEHQITPAWPWKVAIVTVPADADAAQLVDLAMAVHRAISSHPATEEWRWKVEYLAADGTVHFGA